jgi:hypothetical protein
VILTVDNLIERVRRCPGINISTQTLAEVVKQTDFTIRGLEEYIAKTTDTELEYNEHGAARFMPKDPEQVKDIRDLWDRCGLDSKAYGPEGNTDAKGEMV